jgi:hypothetical protein
MKKLLTAGLVLTVVALLGCASHDAARSDRNESNQIVDISIDNNSDALILKIQAIQSLIFTEDRIADPKGVVFSLPGAKIGRLKGLYSVPENEAVRYVRADTYAVNMSPVATIYIALKAEAPYEVTRQDAVLQIRFPRHTGRTDKLSSRAKPTAVKPKPPGVQQVRPTAAVLLSVDAKAQKDALAVNLIADGSITQYNAFTIEKPARIVFDIFKIKTPYFKEKIIRVQSNVARQIRYCGHPDKMRLVIDTRKEFFSKFSSAPTDTGLMIRVGKLQD